MKKTSQIERKMNKEVLRNAKEKHTVTDVIRARQ